MQELQILLCDSFVSPFVVDVWISFNGRTVRLWLQLQVCVISVNVYMTAEKHAYEIVLCPSLSMEEITRWRTAPIVGGELLGDAAELCIYCRYGFKCRRVISNDEYMQQRNQQLEHQQKLMKESK